MMFQIMVKNYFDTFGQTLKCSPLKFLKRLSLVTLIVKINVKLVEKTLRVAH